MSLFYRQDHNLAIAHPAGPSLINDGLSYFLGANIFHPNRDLDFGEKSGRELGVGVLIEVALLAPKPFRFANLNGFNRSPLQTTEQLFGKERLDDCDDLFQSSCFPSKIEQSDEQVIS